MQRKLIRATDSSVLQNPPARPRRRARPAAGDRTGSEERYYLDRMRDRALVTFTLTDDSRFRARIEWYDRMVVGLVCDDGHRLVLYKRTIRLLS